MCVFQTLPDNAVSTYAASLREKGALVPALYKVIRENYSDVWTHILILCILSSVLFGLWMDIWLLNTLYFPNTAVLHPDIINAICKTYLFSCPPPVAGASVSPVVWVLPEWWAAAAAFHATVPARAPVEPPVRQRSQRPPHLRLHRGPAAGHLQPGRGEDEGGGCAVCLNVQCKNLISELIC